MTTPRFGKTTVVKLLGGQLIVRQAGTDMLTMRRELEGIKARALDLRVPFQRFQRVWLAQTAKVFANEGLPRKWPRLSPAYAAWKAQHFPGATIMRRTDRLYESLTQAGSGALIWEVTPRTIRYGSKVPYWQYHTKTRPTLVLLPATFAELHRLVMAWLNGARRG